MFEIPSNVKKTINKSDLTIAENHVKELNNIIRLNNVKKVSLEDGFVVTVSDKDIPSINTSTSENNPISNNSVSAAAYNSFLATPGVTKTNIHWNYIDIWLSKGATKYLLYGGASVYAGLILAIPGVNVAILGILSVALDSIVIDIINMGDTPATVTRYNYFSGVQWIGLQLTGGDYFIIKNF